MRYRGNRTSWFNNEKPPTEAEVRRAELKDWMLNRLGGRGISPWAARQIGARPLPEGTISPIIKCEIFSVDDKPVEGFIWPVVTPFPTPQTLTVKGTTLYQLILRNIADIPKWYAQSNQRPLWPRIRVAGMFLVKYRKFEIQYLIDPDYPDSMPAETGTVPLKLREQAKGKFPFDRNHWRKDLYLELIALDILRNFSDLNTHQAPELWERVNLTCRAIVSADWSGVDQVDELLHLLWCIATEPSMSLFRRILAHPSPELKIKNIPCRSPVICQKTEDAVNTTEQPSFF